MSISSDLTGKRFDRLTVIARCDTTAGDSKWLCRCDCGIEKTIFRGNLKKTKSCGCIKVSQRPKCPEVAVWQSMLSRCYNPKNVSFKNYGGRGIGVCARWRGSFANFLTDVGSRPIGQGGKISAYSLDRIDNDGDYAPGNVRWVKAIKQHSNKRSNRNFTIDEQTLTLTEWAHQFGKSASVVRFRLKKGMGLLEALTTALRPYCKEVSV